MQSTNIKRMDIFGKAVLDYQNGNLPEDIITYSSLDEEALIPTSYLFRSFKEMPEIEQKALQSCKGDVLDIGCGAGSHSLYLQEKGHAVVALDNSKGAIETCRLRGVKHTVHSNILDYSGQKFDTLLLLMNGIGLAGNLADLSQFLSHLKLLLRETGQILLDSSDIIYMFDPDEDGGYWIPAKEHYYGEVEFTMHYKDLKGIPFKWLYIDFNTLQLNTSSIGLSCELVSEGEHYDYLARLTLA